MFGKQLACYPGMDDCEHHSGPAAGHFEDLSGVDP
jgi:hypothetical protein